MSHDRKKGGERKDKKNERMRESVEFRKEMAQPHPSTDQPDLQSYKPGHPGDRNRAPHPDQPQKR